MRRFVVAGDDNTHDALAAGHGGDYGKDDALAAAAEPAPKSEDDAATKEAKKPK